MGKCSNPPDVIAVIVMDFEDVQGRGVAEGDQQEATGCTLRTRLAGCPGWCTSVAPSRASDVTSRRTLVVTESVPPYPARPSTNAVAFRFTCSTPSGVPLVFSNSKYLQGPAHTARGRACVSVSDGEGRGTPLTPPPPPGTS